jgi:hypothetical protein
MKRIIAGFVLRLIDLCGFRGARGTAWTRSPALALLAVAAFAAAPAANAAVLFSNFGPGDSYDTSTGWSVSSSAPQDPAMPFTVAGSGYVLSSVNMALNNSAASPSSLIVQIMSDVGGLPGTVIESMTLSVPTGMSIVTGLSALNPTLVAGTTYWLATDALNFEGAWQWTDPNVLGPTAFSFNGGSTWEAFNLQTAAFRINGETEFAVPEPGSIALAALALVGMLVVARTKRSV